jgi:uncharacterized protein (TIGR02117 family)
MSLPKKKSSIKRIIYYCLLAIASFFTLLAIGYFTPITSCNITPEKCAVTICIDQDGMLHTNILVPSQNQIVDWSQFISFPDIGKDPIANYKYLTFGWGDRDFYIQTPTFADLNVITALRALFLPTPSTILVQAFTELPPHRADKCVKVTQTEYLQLTNFIQNTFKLNPQGKPIRIADGYLRSSGFYEAYGNYSIFRTCNNWTAEGLRKANVDTPLWAGLSSAVMLHFGRTCECRISD